MKKVTVVVPVYKDWQTLEKCIISLQKYLDSRNTVLLINDLSSEWEILEDNIKGLIQGSKNFKYYRNDNNLGFVKTCNRAVFELDKTSNDIFLLNSDTEVTEGFMEELITVLNSSEKHGCVCPRSNNATFLSVPYRTNGEKNISPQESYKAYSIIKKYLPKQTVVPTGVGFALLIKRHLIEEYGLFDEIYSHGYNEENDFCMRINQFGYNVVMANYAFVYHYESKSFGKQKIELDKKNAEILTNRYPYYFYRTDMYFSYQINPIDFFGDLIADIYDKKRILFSLYEMPAAYNGTSQHGLNLLSCFWEQFHNKYDISILINEDADRLFKVSSKYPNVFSPLNIVGTFHLTYVPSQIIHIEHLHLLNKITLKYAFCMQDIISIRSSYLLVQDWEREIVFEKSLKYCDCIIPFSSFSLNDTLDYYHDLFAEKDCHSKVVYLASTERVMDTENIMLPFDNYFVVLGNQYKHKNLDNVIPFFRKSKHNFIIIGTLIDGKISDNIYGYISGNLSDEMLSNIMKNSTGVIFPSVYEGFGLPVLNAITYQKKIVLYNNSLNNELSKWLTHFRKYMYQFKKVDEIEGFLDEIENNPIIPEKPEELCNRKWTDVAIEVENVLSEILNKPIDSKTLLERWKDLTYEERIHCCYRGNGQVVNSIEDLIKLDNKEFINGAYQLLLKRMPDETGVSHYCDKIKPSLLSKYMILYRIANSEEGKSKKANIPGLKIKIIREFFNEFFKF